MPSVIISHNLAIHRDRRHWQGGSGLQGLGRSHFGGFHAQEGRHGEERPAESQRGHLQEPRFGAGEVCQEDCQGRNHIAFGDKHRHVDSRATWINFCIIHCKTISVLHRLVVNACNSVRLSALAQVEFWNSWTQSATFSNIEKAKWVNLPSSKTNN